MSLVFSWLKILVGLSKSLHVEILEPRNKISAWLRVLRFKKKVIKFISNFDDGGLDPNSFFFCKMFVHCFVRVRAGGGP